MSAMAPHDSHDVCAQSNSRCSTAHWEDGTPKSTGNAFDVPPRRVESDIPLIKTKEELKAEKHRAQSRTSYHKCKSRPWLRYEEEKRAWVKANPMATIQEYVDAIKAIAERLGL